VETLADARRAAVTVRCLVAVIIGAAGCSAASTDPAGSGSCRGNGATCQPQMVAASVGRGPFLMQMGEEIFYGAFAADGSPLVARLTESTGENAILLSGVGVRTYGVSVLAADEEAIY